MSEDWDDGGWFDGGGISKWVGGGGISEWVGGSGCVWGMVVCGGGLRLSVCVWVGVGRMDGTLTSGWGWMGRSGI